MNIYYQNVRGLNSKLLDIYTNSFFSDHDIIALTETWLTDSVHNNELFDSNNYVVYRNDRDGIRSGKARGGGVLCAVHIKYKSSLVKIDHNPNSLADIICVRVKIGCGNDLFIVVLYSPPPTTFVQHDMLYESLESCHSLMHSDFIILGDLNLNKLTDNYNNGYSNNCISRFENFCHFFNASQLNTVLNCDLRLLDVVLSNMGCCVSHNTCPLVPEDRYHPALSVAVNVNVSCSRSTITNNDLSYNFRLSDFKLMYTLLENVDWDILLTYNDIDAAFVKFYAILDDIFKNCVPLTRRKKSRYPPWFTKQIISDIKLKDKNRILFKRLGDHCYNTAFRYFRAKVKRDIKKAYKNYLINTENDITNNPKQFWSFLNKKRKTSRIPGDMYRDNKVYTDTPSIVQGFADYFASAYSTENITINFSNIYNESVSSNYVAITNISHDDIIFAINTLKASCTAGPDNLPAYILKGCRDLFIKPLHILFNLSLSQNIFPSVLKTSSVCPIFKSGDLHNMSNYRPISILSNIAKCFEKILYRHIYRNVCKAISPNQHGFMQGRSTSTNLTNFSEFIITSLNSNTQIDVIYTDIAKAFDSVNHNILLYKLQYQFNFSPELLQLMQSYLNDRKQYVYYNNFKSDQFTPLSGVPQGSNLGPLLFNLFVNDITYCLRSSNALLYADDLKLFKVINSDSDQIQLQSDIDNLLVWSSSSLLSFNVNKCKIMTYSMKQNPCYCSYKMRDMCLVRVRIYKDLGVIFDSKFSFTAHLEYIINSSYKNLGFIIRNSQLFQKASTLKSLYFSFVRSKLEYCVIIWNPIYKNHSSDIEWIQRKFVRFCAIKLFLPFNSYTYSYTATLVKLNMITLESRRNMHSCLYLHNLFYNKIDDISSLSLININIPRISSRSKQTFFLTTIKSNYEIRAPIRRLCSIYNQFENLLNIDIFCNSYSYFKCIILQFLTSCEM